jgi:hypothetical protein
MLGQQLEKLTEVIEKTGIWRGSDADGSSEAGALLERRTITHVITQASTIGNKMAFKSHRVFNPGEGC